MTRTADNGKFASVRHWEGSFGSMNQPIPRLLVVLVAMAAAATVAATGCGGGAKSTETSTSHSVDPTAKGAKPGGANNFSPTAVAPLTPTAGPGQSGTTPRP